MFSIFIFPNVDPVIITKRYWNIQNNTGNVQVSLGYRFIGHFFFQIMTYLVIFSSWCILNYGSTMTKSMVVWMSDIPFFIVIICQEGWMISCLILVWNRWSEKHHLFLEHPILYPTNVGIKYVYVEMKKKKKILL